ncbi:hypothetical protein OSB04_028904 [Centaurea solstitialis]|uniref:CCHC-type domain-containing protein n=1 Tax=Centaurea solstitialis TaxID=347529 RepID=A0AA38SHE9_9ASTR|nr:hypothetical protein OSB04_028904 [Centaurea solstitialis]
MSLANRRDDMSMGSETKAPVLFKDEYELWVSRFKLYIRRKKDGDKILHSILHGPHPIPVTTLDGRQVPKEYSEMDVAERERFMIDVEAQNCLIQAIPNEIFRKLDSYDESAKSIWDQLQKIMMGSKVGNQMRVTNLMDRYENFKMKEDETLEETYDRLVELMNDMKKNNIIRSEMDYIVKFINNLSSDWKQFSRFVKQHKVLNELKVYEVYENLLLFEEEVNEIAAERKKKEKSEADSMALLAEKEKAKKKIRKGKAKVLEVFEDEEEEDEDEYDEDERDQMLQSLLSLTEAYKKKYYNRSGSNNRRVSTRGGRGFNRNYMQSSQGYPPRVENQYVDRYATKKEEVVKDTPEKTEEKKGQAGITCYKCGKTGHIAKGCTTKMSKVELLRKKLELVEKQEQGLVLMADDEEWLDYSDNDDQAQMCFMGLMEEESESDEEIESEGETSTKREKLSYIRGTTIPPKETDEEYEKWYADNQKVKRWLLMSMKPEIMKRYLRLSTAYKIWTTLSKAFCDGSDELQKAFTSKQNGKSFYEYYGELTTIFLELDHRDKVVMKDPYDVKAYRRAIDRLRVHIFVRIRGEILRKDPILELEECYALIRRKATRHATLMGDSDNIDASVMIAR